jgi:hypothetical protein
MEYDGQRGPVDHGRVIPESAHDSNSLENSRSVLGASVRSSALKGSIGAGGLSNEGP